MLRSLLSETGLSEELKWGVPCYTYGGSNVAILSALCDSCVPGFFKGVLLRDEEGHLVKPGENSQAVRQFRFTGEHQIVEKNDLIKAYLLEAIEVEKSGFKYERNPEPIPDELQVKLDEDPLFRSAFESLTPGRRRGYILHFSQPKKRETREERIRKWTPRILNGEGMHDRYRRKSKKR
jgi:uncharacterized protein YdeI (YjbR/CyaY-like superfamily)